MTDKKDQTIAIIGAGLTGCFLSILLAERGYKVEIYERLSREDVLDENSKRSYNITFRTYGIKMLQQAGVWDELQPYFLPLKGAYTQLSKNSKPIVSLITDKNQLYLSVSRSDLLKVLIRQMSKHPLITAKFESSLLSIDRRKKTFIVQNEKSKIIKTVSCTVIIGADGANSLVRTFIQQGQNTNYIQEYSSGGYKQFTISKKEVETLSIRNDLAYTWSADNKFILAFPNLNGSLSSLIIYPNDKSALLALSTQNSLKKLISNEFPHLVPIQDSIIQQILENPVGSFVTIHTDPWYYKDFITLVGDSAHGFYPFFGQGTTAGFSDSMQLVKFIDKFGPDWEKIFTQYQKIQKRHMDSLGELSKQALKIYARNKRADFDVIYNKLEEVGHHFFPEHIKPPVFQQVTDNPEKTADYVDTHDKQRRMAKVLGISLLVLLMTGSVKIIEKLDKAIK